MAVVLVLVGRGRGEGGGGNTLPLTSNLFLLKNPMMTGRRIAVPMVRLAIV